MVENRGFTPDTQANTSFLQRQLGVPFSIPSETALSGESKRKADELMANLGAWFMKTPTLPSGEQDKVRYRRIPSLIILTGQQDYLPTVRSVMERAEEEYRKTAPPRMIEALEAEAGAIGAVDVDRSIGTTVFNEQSDLAAAIVLQRPGENVGQKEFLNSLAEEVLHAASPRNTVLKTVRGATVNLVELMNRYVRSLFLEAYDPGLVLDGERELFSLLRERFDPIRERVLNIHLRGRA